jgi:CheY-like chemotaxis protein
MDKKPIAIIIEDEELLLQAIVSKMKKEGIETISCSKAEQALDYLSNMTIAPDVIWLDYYLEGGMNGIEFLEKIKQNPKWMQIPVLAVTNTASPEKVDKMVALGIVKYFVKAENKLEEMVKCAKQVAEKDPNLK